MVKDMTKKRKRLFQGVDTIATKTQRKSYSTKVTIANEINNSIDIINTLRPNKKAEILLSELELSYIKNLLNMAISFLRGGEFCIKTRSVNPQEMLTKETSAEYYVEPITNDNKQNNR